MGFRMTEFSGPCAKPNKPRHQARLLFLCKTKRWPRPSPSAIVRERLFFNSESEGPLAIRDIAPFRLTAGDGLATPIPRRGLSFPV
jgi:hypothetical protein